MPSSLSRGRWMWIYLLQSILYSTSLFYIQILIGIHSGCCKWHSGHSETNFSAPTPHQIKKELALRSRKRKIRIPSYQCPP